MNFPHHYRVAASAKPSGPVGLSCNGRPDIESGPPPEFGGTGQQWSPEDLLVGAVADCFVLSFRAVAAASKFEWNSLDCQVTGTLSKVERAVMFTELQIVARLAVPAGADHERAKRLLEKAEQTCFITNSLKAPAHLELHLSQSD
jgi:organic hydroperoxide reductase OsmC/OhrA